MSKKALNLIVDYLQLISEQLYVIETILNKSGINGHVLDKIKKNYDNLHNNDPKKSELNKT